MEDNKNINELESDVEVTIEKKPNVFTKLGNWVDNFSWKSALVKVAVFTSGAIAGAYAYSKVTSKDDDNVIDVSSEDVTFGDPVSNDVEVTEF